MEKLIIVGGIEKTFRSNGATPIKYRRLFKGADFFRDMMGMRNIDPENMSDEEIERIEKLAFAMCEDSNLPDMTFEKWMEQFELFDVFNAAPEIMGLVTENLETQAIPNKSKNAEPAES